VAEAECGEEKTSPGFATLSIFKRGKWRGTRGNEPVTVTYTVGFAIRGRRIQKLPHTGLFFQALIVSFPILRPYSITKWDKESHQPCMLQTHEPGGLVFWFPACYYSIEQRTRKTIS